MIAVLCTEEFKEHKWRPINNSQELSPKSHLIGQVRITPCPTTLFRFLSLFTALHLLHIQTAGHCTKRADPKTQGKKKPTKEKKKPALIKEDYGNPPNARE